MRRPYSEEWNEFTSLNPYRSVEAEGLVFRYISVGDDSSPAIVFLNGGLNTSELWLGYLDCHLIDGYRAIIFDYPLGAESNQKLIVAMHTFFEKLGLERPVLVGAMFGGMLAQIYAKRYRGDVSALILIASNGMDRSTIRSFRRKYRWLPVTRFFLKHRSAEKIQRKLVKMGDEVAERESEEDRKYIHDMFRFIFRNYTKEKNIHIKSLMADVMNQHPMERNDFYNLKGRILLLFPSDNLFTTEMQQNLESLMIEPEIRRLRGNSASTYMKPELLLSEMLSFLKRIGY